MTQQDALAQKLQATLQAFCVEHNCEIVLLALLPPVIARAIGLEQASVPVEIRVVKRGASLPEV